MANRSKVKRDRDLKVRSTEKRCKKQQETRGKIAEKQVAKGYNLEASRGDPKHRKMLPVPLNGMGSCLSPTRQIQDLSLLMVQKTQTK